MRNIVAHDYARVDLAIVWEVATVHLPELSVVLEKFFTNLENRSKLGRDATE